VGRAHGRDAEDAPGATEQVIESYYLPAGSKRWLKACAQDGRPDYWQTGRDLWESKSGIITDPLGNLQKVPDDSRLFVMPGVVCGAMCAGADYRRSCMLGEPEGFAGGERISVSCGRRQSGR
jgi:hypothetical protein